MGVPVGVGVPLVVGSVGVGVPVSVVLSVGVGVGHAVPVGPGDGVGLVVVVSVGEAVLVTVGVGHGNSVWVDGLVLGALGGGDRVGVLVGDGFGFGFGFGLCGMPSGGPGLTGGTITRGGDGLGLVGTTGTVSPGTPVA